MTYFYQGAAAVLIGMLVCLVLDKQGKDYAALICVCVCAMVMLLAAAYLEPVLNFLRELEHLANLETSFIRILFKVTGIGILTEIARLICTDAGNASMGKVLQILSAAVILWLSIPIFQEMLDLIQKILGEV